MTCNDVDQMTEAKFNLLEVLKDIGVIELDIVDHHGLGKVVKEFGSFVEKGGVVFVSFENEIVRIAKGSALRQVSGDPADQKTRITARLPKDPGDQRGGGRLTMRPGDHDVPFALEKEIFERFGQRAVEEFSIEHRL